MSRVEEGRGRGRSTWLADGSRGDGGQRAWPCGHPPARGRGCRGDDHAGLEDGDGEGRRRQRWSGTEKSQARCGRARARVPEDDDAAAEKRAVVLEEGSGGGLGAGGGATDDEEADGAPAWLSPPARAERGSKGRQWRRARGAAALERSGDGDGWRRWREEATGSRAREKEGRGGGAPEGKGKIEEKGRGDRAQGARWGTRERGSRGWSLS